MFTKQNVAVGIRQKAIDGLVNRGIVVCEDDTYYLNNAEIERKKDTFIISHISVDLPESLEEIEELMTEDQAMKLLQAKIVTEAVNSERAKWNSPDSKRAQNDAKKLELLAKQKTEMQDAIEAGDIDRANRIMSHYADEIMKLR